MKEGERQQIKEWAEQAQSFVDLCQQAIKEGRSIEERHTVLQIDWRPVDGRPSPIGDWRFRMAPRKPLKRWAVVLGGDYLAWIGESKAAAQSALEELADRPGARLVRFVEVVEGGDKGDALLC